MHEFDIVFEKLAELARDEAREGQVDSLSATASELDEIDELRRYAAELQESQPPTFTTT